MKKLHSVLVACGMLAAVLSTLAADSATTRGIIDMSKPERPADAVTLVGAEGYQLVPEGAGPTKWVFADGILTASGLSAANEANSYANPQNPNYPGTADATNCRIIPGMAAR